MGILNVTPDSFYDGGKFTEQKEIIRKVAEMIEEGARIIDIGAQSSRPGAEPVSAKEELIRLLPALDAVLQQFPEIIISVDTYNSEVANKAIEKGASIINDISAGDLDKEMFSFIAEKNVPYILMHMQGTPVTMHKNPVYKNVVTDVIDELGTKVFELRKRGVNDIIVDPGFGFGKTVVHNFELLDNLKSFKMLECPILAGVSRKSMICKTLGVNPDKALNGTTALNMVALMNGANILRVHDVGPAKEVVALFERLN